MFYRISQTWSIMGACWRVLLEQKRLLVFPLLSGIACLLVLASFAVPLFYVEGWQSGQEETGMSEPIFYGLLFLFYFCNYFVMTFFNSALVSCAIARMMGRPATVGQGLGAAAQRLPQIFGWALVAATVGLVLQIIENQSEKAGRFVAGLLGVAWTMVSFLVVPVIVVKKSGPFAALKDSSKLLTRTWGNQIVGNFSFGILFLLLGIPGWALIGFGIHLASSVSPALGVAAIIAGVLYAIVLALVQSALKVIFQGALYLYAGDNTVPEGFSERMLRSAAGPR